MHFTPNNLAAIDAANHAWHDVAEALAAPASPDMQVYGNCVVTRKRQSDGALQAWTDGMSADGYIDYKTFDRLRPAEAADGTTTRRAAWFLLKHLEDSPPVGAYAVLLTRTDTVLDDGAVQADEVAYRLSVETPDVRNQNDSAFVYHSTRSRIVYWPEADGRRTTLSATRLPGELERLDSAERMIARTEDMRRALGLVIRPYMPNAHLL